ncbi:MAG: sugar phosphate isomerase/epimerase, partial [Verrucomicrobiae bacterium]|nr:sugar phosphate isomerase/epimerase [Verrucomicrobiae bacterium]
RSPSRELFQSVAGIRRQAEEFNCAAEACRSRNITCQVHNHWWEFATVEGRCAYEWLLEALQPTVKLQLDVYWAQTGGHNPADWIRRLGPRAPTLHVKDGPCVVGQPMTAVGEGRVDIAACLQAAANTVEWFIVELDECATDMMDAVRNSARYLLKLAR